MSEYKIKEVFNNKSEPVDKIILEVFKEYCINYFEKIAANKHKKEKI